MNTSSFVPITEARKWDDECLVDLTRLAGQIPDYAGKERIGVNLEAVHSLAKLARVRALRVMGSEEEEVSYGIAGSTKGGTAVASHAIAVSKSKTNSILVDSESVIAPKVTDETVTINFNEFTRQDNVDLRNPADWAGFIDKELERELLKICAGKNLKPELTKFAFEICSLTAVIIQILWVRRNIDRQLLFLSFLTYLFSVAFNIVKGDENVFARNLSISLPLAAGYSLILLKMNPLTLANIEWDRFLRSFYTLSTNTLVAEVMDEIED